MAMRSGPGSEPLLRGLGEQIRSLRSQRAWSRAALAGRSGLSVRFLAELEGGGGNISIGRLQDLAASFGVRASVLLAQAEQSAERPQSADAPIALLGLRGAGKSTVGQALADRLGRPFIELDDRIAQAAGIPLEQVFELHGEGYYRRVEREVLTRYLLSGEPGVLATGGGIVTEAETFDLLCRRTVTVWLRAQPRDHWNRVVSQGDVRPMANRAHAMEELEALLTSREALYRRAGHVVDTSALGVVGAVDRIVEVTGAQLGGGTGHVDRGRQVDSGRAT